MPHEKAHCSLTVINQPRPGMADADVIKSGATKNRMPLIAAERERQRIVWPFMYMRVMQSFSAEMKSYPFSQHWPIRICSGLSHLQH